MAGGAPTVSNAEVRIRQARYPSCRSPARRPARPCPAGSRLPSVTVTRVIRITVVGARSAGPSRQRGRHPGRCCRSGGALAGADGAAMVPDGVPGYPAASLGSNGACWPAHWAGPAAQRGHLRRRHQPGAASSASGRTPVTTRATSASRSTAWPDAVWTGLPDVLAAGDCVITHRAGPGMSRRRQPRCHPGSPKRSHRHHETGSQWHGPAHGL